MAWKRAQPPAKKGSERARRRTKRRANIVRCIAFSALRVKPSLLEAEDARAEALRLLAVQGRGAQPADRLVREARHDLFLARGVRPVVAGGRADLVEAARADDD